jgi:Protein of unknown function (DUF2442)
MEISEAEFARANQRMAKRRKAEPYAVAAEYEAARNMIAVSLSNGAEVRFPVAKLQGLAGAKADELAHIEIDPAGYGLSFPKLNAEFSLPALMQGVFGSRTWMAALLGREGGKSASPGKVIAARSNGRLGGRPKKAGNVV